MILNIIIIDLNLNLFFLLVVCQSITNSILVDKYLIDKSEITPHVVYAAHTLGGKWLPDVVDCNDVNADGYAGIVGKSIDGFRAKLTYGDIVYRAHIKGRNDYLPWVKNLDVSEVGYAGVYGSIIDGIQAYIENVPGYSVEYRVAINGKYLPWVKNCGTGADGYAGIYGKPIDKVQFRVVKR